MIVSMLHLVFINRCSNPISGRFYTVSGKKIKNKQTKSQFVCFFMPYWHIFNWIQRCKDTEVLYFHLGNILYIFIFLGYWSFTIKMLITKNNRFIRFQLEKKEREVFHILKIYILHNFYNSILILYNTTTNLSL